jgi:hypothetical protein
MYITAQGLRAALAASAAGAAITLWMRTTLDRFQSLAHEYCTFVK